MNLRRTAGVVAGLVVVAALNGAGPAGAQDPPPAAAGHGQLRTVTLLTGDQVRVVDGKVVGVRMGAGRERQSVWQYQMNGHQYVLPIDAGTLVQQDRLDKRLFDITELVRQELDDSATTTVPLIVQGAAPPATERTGAVPTRGLTVVEAPKTGAAWRAMFAARAASGKVWLNGRVKANLEDSVPQIGAPEAWAAGFTGTGAKVAVLDTGYDADHPDLAGVVDAAQDFSGEGIADTVGHGTHVASTIAGTGAASGGKRKGVAPGAHLLIGKVLGEYGGSEADVIAGMQWAVDQGADVVNMSLGGGPTDGTDLMSQTLNELSDSSGTLFVVAAGNSGARETVGSPGTADRALTVGSVTKDDKLSVFSSQGPRLGDFGLKPEISAPGSDIVAARAAGTNPDISVDQDYTRMSGTSMATPHVVGAAAILAGEHPDWTGSQLKDALVGSVKRLDGVDTFAQGAGRLDIARGARQEVRAEGMLGFGQQWAGTESELARKINYVNDGDAPVTLDVKLETNSDLFTVDSPRVTVPAHGSTTVTVTAQVPTKPVGDVSGALVATAEGVTITTPLTANLPGTAHTLTVKILSRDENPDTSLVIVQNEKTGYAQVAVVEGDATTFTVPAGRYRVVGRAMDFVEQSDTLFVEPTTVDKDTELVVDAKKGREITSGVDDPDARAQLAGGTAILSDTGGNPVSLARTGNVSRTATLYAIGSPRMKGVSLVHFGYWTQPFATVTVDGPDGFEAEDTYVSSYPRLDGTVTGDVAWVGFGDRAAIDAARDVRGKIAVIAAVDPSDPTWPPGEQLRDGIALLAERGAKLVLSNYNPQADVAPPYPDLPLPVVMVFNNRDLQDVVARAADGPVTMTVVGRQNSPTAYFVADQVTGQVPAGHAFRFTRASMGVIDRELVDTLPDKRYRYMPTNWTFAGFTAGGDVELDWPHRRIDYVTPGAALTTFGSAGFTDDGNGVGNEVAVPMIVKRGERKQVRMFGAPFGPELTTAPTSRQDGEPVPYAYRQGDKLVLNVPMFADNDPADASGFDPTQTGTTVLRKDGVELARRDDLAGLATFDVPAGQGTYTVVADAQRQAELLEPALSPHTTADWTFRSGAGTRERVALPFLDVRWDLPLDDHNRATTGVLRGGVTVATQPGARAAKVRSVTVDVSYDDGRTWRRATVDHKGAGWQVRLPAGGAAGGYASLRATASDSAGNRVTETVLRAYGLR